VQEFAIRVITSAGIQVACRLCTQLIPAEMQLIGLEFQQPPGSETACLHLTVRAASRNRLDLFVRRLDRIVDVYRATVIEPDVGNAHSIYVSLCPDGSDLEHVDGLLRWYNAEQLDLPGFRMVVHLKARAPQHAGLVAALRPFHVVSVTTEPPSADTIAAAGEAYTPPTAS
jgi:hypothetical protein